MKVIACLTVFLAFAGVGLVIYRRAKNRVNFFDALLTFCRSLNTEISFTLTPVSIVIDNFHCASRDFHKTICNYKKLLVDKTDVTREGCLDALWTGLNKFEAEKTADFLYSLGRTAAKEERDKIDAAVSTFTAFHADAKAALATKASIAFKVLIIMGIAGVILLL